MRGDNYMEAPKPPLSDTLCADVAGERWIRCYFTDHGSFYAQWQKGKHRGERVQASHFISGYARWVLTTLPLDSLTGKIFALLAADNGVSVAAMEETLEQLKRQAKLKQKERKAMKEAKSVEEVVTNIQEKATW